MNIINNIVYQQVKPEAALADFVDSYWMLHNTGDEAQSVIGLPDGRVDLFFTQSVTQPFNIVLIGIGTRTHPSVIDPHTLMFAISFKLPAVEYILGFPIADMVDGAKELPNDFWRFNVKDLDDFDAFCEKAAQKLLSLLPKEMDERKRRLFQLIYESKGEMSVLELSERVYWSARQINRYFNQQFGVSLKVFCNILRFRMSLEHIAKGRLFPELNFTDQNHFIKEIKKFSGAVPKELFKNQNDRFILLSAIRQQ